MVRSVTTFDEDFTEEDMGAALEWQSEQATRCSCGFPFDETTAVGRDESYASEMVTCHACASGDRVERAYREDQGDMAGVRRRTWEVED